MNNMGMWQSKLQQMQDEVKNTRATGEAGAGMVKVTVNGLGNVFDVKIDPALMTPDNTHTLEVLFASASNAAIQSVQDTLKQKNMDLISRMGQQ